MKLYRTIVTCALVLVAVPVHADEKIDVAKLVGTWEVVKGDISTVTEGSTFDFRKDGTCLMNLKQGNQTLKFKLTYKVEGDKLMTTVEGATGARTVTIQKLADKELVWEERGKKVVELKKK